MWRQSQRGGIIISVFDDFKLYIAAFIGGILIGALLYREIEKRYFRELATPLSKVIEQSVVREKITSLTELGITFNKTVIQIQEEAETIFDQLTKIADMEDGEIKQENESTSSLRELSKMRAREQQADESEEIAKALRNLFEKN
jgi:hypothetical protein